MHSDRSAPELIEQLARATAKIAELQAALASRESSAVQSPGSILESFTDAFVAVDRNFSYTWVNTEAERLMGIPREEVLGRAIWDVFPDDAGTILDRKTRQALAENRPQEFDYYSASQQRWYRSKAFPTNEGGLAICWRDITEQKRVESELRRQALVLEQVHDSIITTDLQGTITSWNRGAADLFGYEASEVIGRNVSLLYMEEDRADVSARVLEPLLREGRAELHMRNRRNSGEECWLRLSLTLLRDENGEPYAMLGVATDCTAQRNAEQALRQSEAMYRGLADAMPQVAYIAGAEGGTELINRHWEKYAGVPVSECMDLDWAAWVHPDDLPSVFERWQQCLQTGEPFEMEYRLRNATGEYRWHLGRAVPVRGLDSAVARWIGICTDIHARRSAEEALQKSEERFRLAAQALQGVVFDWNPQTGVVHRTGDLARILGIGPDQAEGTEEWWQERIHPDDAHDSALRTLQRRPGGQTVFETEFRIRHADGRWVDVCDRGYIVRDETGDPVRVVGSSQNVTVRKQLEREIRDYTAKLKFQSEILATTDDAVIAIDADQRVTYFSPGAERMYGVSSSDALGQQLADIYRFEWPNPADETAAWAQLAERGTWSGSNVHVTHDGKRLFVNSTVNVLPPQAGSGMVAVIRDETAKRKAELENISKSTELARANADLLHFAYAVSHDLQAPLRTIVSFSQLLSLRYGSALDEQGSEFIQMIVDAGSRAATMIRDLMTFAKCAGAELKFDPRVSLEAAVDTAVKDLGNEVRATSALITVESLPLVSGDAGQLAQLFQNLIANSLKYRKAGTTPEIRISAERGEGEWVIQVRDNGIGFEAKHSERIFDVFKRLHGAEYPGTGVGLAICKRIVERRGGRIWATGQTGEGAVFSFSIPDVTGESTVELPSVSPAIDEWAFSPAAFGEVFQTLDLAQAMVRDLQGTILVWTKGAERLFGWSKSEAVGRNAHELLRTEFVPQSRHEIEAELLNRGEWNGELRKFRRDGRAVWVAAHWALYRDGGGRPQSVIEVASDITSLKEVEQALHRSSAQRELALCAGQMGVWSWDCRTGVVEWDQTTELLHGVAAGASGRSFDAFLQLVHPEDRTQVKARVEESLVTGSEFSTEYRLLSGHGSRRLRGQGLVMRGEKGEAAGLIGVVWDISRGKPGDD